MSKEKHAFLILEELIKEYSENKSSFNAEKLQDIREDIALCLFNLSNSASIALSNYDYAEHARKSKAAEREIYHRDETGTDGKRLTVSEAQNLARIDCKQEVENCKEALRQKRRVEIILSSTNAILHAIASRLTLIK